MMDHLIHIFLAIIV